MSEIKVKTGAAALLLGSEALRLRRAGRLSCLAALIWLPMAWCAAAVLAGLIAGGGLGGGSLDGGDLGLVWLAAFVGFGAIRAGLLGWADALAQDAAGGALSRIRRALVQGVGLRAVLPRAGGFASLAGDQVAMIGPSVARYGPARLRATVVPMVVLVAAFATAWAAGLILLIAGPAIPVFMALVGQAAGKASRDQLNEMGNMGALLADRIGALPDMRLLGAQAAFSRQFADAADALRQRTMRVLGIAFLSSTVLELFAALGIAMMAVFCGFSLLGQVAFGTWGGPLTVFQALFLLLIAPEFFQPLRDLAAVWHDRAGADAAAEALADDAADPACLPQDGSGGIALSGVRLRGVAYPDLALAPGDAVAITGASGAGKTSLLRLLAGLEVAEAGQLDRPARASIGWMPQRVHFLDDSLDENLRLGRSGDLTDALQQAAAQHLILGLPHGLQTRLGEQGAGLSGGEARRLTLARALFGRPAVLMADEPTADLDAQTAQLVTQALLAAHRAGATLIVATHDRALVAAIGREYRIGDM